MCCKENLKILESGDIGNYITNFEDNRVYSSFYLKENDENLKYILNEEIVEMRATLIKIDGQPVIVLLFKFAGNNKFIYGRIYNKEIPLDEEHLQMLIFQSTIPISFVRDDSKIIATTLVENDFKELIKEYIIKKKNKYTPSYDLTKKYKLEDLWMDA